MGAAAAHMASYAIVMSFWLRLFEICSQKLTTIAHMTAIAITLLILENLFAVIDTITTVSDLCNAVENCAPSPSPYMNLARITHAASILCWEEVHFSTGSAFTLFDSLSIDERKPRNGDHFGPVLPSVLRAISSRQAGSNLAVFRRIARLANAFLIGPGIQEGSSASVV